MTENKRLNVALAAIDPYIQQNIVLPKETLLRGKDMVEWGTRNQYPEYLHSLYMNTPTLQSIINGTVDFITGNEITILPLVEGRMGMNKRGDTIREQVHDIAHDLEKIGGFALEVIRDLTGKPVETYFCDMRYLRSNKENTVFYYSEKWAKPGIKKVLIRPAFYPFTPEEWRALTPEERDRHAASILFMKNVRTQTYPAPVYGSAVRACEIERGIADYHLNALENSFTSSLIINFNNGQPTDQEKEEIERDINEKFSGHSNAGRILLSWNPDKTNATTITEPKVADFGARYDALAKYARQAQFTAFRANPNLFGIPTENLGFSQEEYDGAFKLYNRTVVRPAQQLIIEAYERIYGHAGVLTIQPFSLDGTTTETNVQ